LGKFPELFYLHRGHTAQGSCAEPRPPQSSGRHDDVDHDAEHEARVEGAPDVTERPPHRMDPARASWKEERGEKNTGGRRWPQGASQRPWRLPQRHLLGRVRDVMRRIPCGQGACGVTVPGSRCKSFVLLVLCGERVPSLPLLAPSVRDSVPMKHLRNCKLQYTYINTEQGSVKDFVVYLSPTDKCYSLQRLGSKRLGFI
jgi:hypothetical protein